MKDKPMKTIECSEYILLMFTIRVLIVYDMCVVCVGFLWMIHTLSLRLNYIHSRIVVPRVFFSARCVRTSVFVSVRNDNTHTYTQNTFTHTHIHESEQARRVTSRFIIILFNYIEQKYLIFSDLYTIIYTQILQKYKPQNKNKMLAIKLFDKLFVLAPLLFILYIVCFFCDLVVCDHCINTK